MSELFLFVLDTKHAKHNLFELTNETVPKLGMNGLLTQKASVRGRVTDKLDERLLHEQTHLGRGCHHVDGAVDGKQGTHLSHLHHLTHHSLAAEPR